MVVGGILIAVIVGAIFLIVAREILKQIYG